jgi:hypothetical protein
MTQIIHYWQVACSVCNSVQYGFGDRSLDVTNPGIRCSDDSCDGNCYVISQTKDKDTWVAQNEALTTYMSNR